MNESENSLNPLKGSLDFPNIISSDAMKQQASYIGGTSDEIQEKDKDTDALIALVQELNQQNHELLHQITLLDEELTTYKSAIASSPPQQLSGQPTQARSSQSSNLDSFNAIRSMGDVGEASHEQVAHLLNHLEFAQQANQRQSIRIESLTTQLDSSQARVSQLETDNGQLSQQCSDQGYHLNQLEDECRDLRLRLQRQQQYTLQFKAALERCLEVPPPSYSLPHPEDDFTLLNDSPVWDGSSPEQMPMPPGATSQPSVPQTSDGQGQGVDTENESADPNWWVQPLFPKVPRIRSWAETQKASKKGAITPKSHEKCCDQLPSPTKEWVDLPLEAPSTPEGLRR
ncbi:MAG: hypothetical protein F6K09_29705, partial [Merismopedia sp. SIO2A8]|nr:hypothetical protein [Merismopedia sp. SIO2A8]